MCCVLDTACSSCGQQVVVSTDVTTCLITVCLFFTFFCSAYQSINQSINQSTFFIAGTCPQNGRIVCLILLCCICVRQVSSAVAQSGSVLGEWWVMAWVTQYSAPNVVGARKLKALINPLLYEKRSLCVFAQGQPTLFILGSLKSPQQTSYQR